MKKFFDFLIIALALGYWTTLFVIAVTPINFQDPLNGGCATIMSIVTGIIALWRLSELKD